MTVRSSAEVIKAVDLTPARFQEALEKEGFLLVSGMLEQSMLEPLRSDLEAAILKESEQHHKPGTREYGMLVACPCYGPNLLGLADYAPLFRPFEWILGDSSIMWVYTSSSIPPGSDNYASRIHVDRPHFIPAYTEALGCLILLDDFTEENGATWVLPGSHLQQEFPGEERFFKEAVRVLAPAGSVFYFHLRLWHAGGINHTEKWRHSLGIGMIRPYLKQRIDLPRALKGHDLSGLSEFALQKLGFYAQVPDSVEAYFAPPEQRAYRQKSEWKD